MIQCQIIPKHINEQAGGKYGHCLSVAAAGFPQRPRRVPREISEQNDDEQAGMVYLINEGRNKQNSINDIEFNKELGIACQKLPDNVSINDLWKILK